MRIVIQLAGDRLNQSKFSSDSEKLEVSNYPMLLKIIYEHNHSINSADALRYRPIVEGVKRKLMKLFAEGHSPSSAYQTASMACNGAFALPVSRFAGCMGMVVERVS